jgi:15-cis-phytoene synthase
MIGSDVQLALVYAPAKLRADCAALLGFDAALGQAFRATDEVGLIQIRLAWWCDQLDQPEARAPVVASLHALMQRHNVSPDMLGAIIDGWAVLLDDPPYSDAQLINYARARGGGLFSAAARMAGGEANERAGLGWALTDFARHCSHPETAARAMALARDALCDNVAATLPKLMRAFAILTRFAQADCLRPLNQQRVAGSPYRIIQAIGFALFAR